MVAGVLAYHRALGLYFSQDDFQGLAQASGLAPRLVQPWRYIANQAVWDVLRPFGVASAWPYHLVSLLAHLACVALLYGLLARRVAPWAAMVGATFFAVHPSLFTALYWISTVGDPLALCFGLLVLRLQGRSDPWRWLAVPSFAVVLLCKESLILLPAVVVAYRAWARRADGQVGSARGSGGPLPPLIDGTVVALVALALVYVVYFLWVAYGTYYLSPTGQPQHAASAPYALGWGVSLWRNLFTYLGWTASFAYPLVQGFSDSVDPSVYPWAGGALAAWLLGLASPGLRRRGWVFGGVAWLLFVLPALPLRNHTYHYYLYAPLAGASWCVAAAVDWALLAAPGRARPARRRDRRGVAEHGAERGAHAGADAAWWVATGLTALLTLNGLLLVRKIETMPFIVPELRAEPIVDRARIARNVYESLAAAGLPAGTTLLFWSPTAASLGPGGEGLARPAAAETYWERNVRSALLDGLAVRVMFPQVVAVRFVREFTPAPPDHRYAVYRLDGKVRVATSSEVDSILRGLAR